MNPELSVLIVEDDPHVLLGCQQALTLEDIPCVGVGSAEEALERVGDNFAGIVISDIRLPGIDGLELLTRLKQRDRSLPVVLITGHGDISMAVGAMQKGAYDFMEKPFSPERLVDVARRALERRYEQPLAFGGCFIYLDPQDALVIWHALPATNGAVDTILSRMLSLVNLEALDSRRSR